jgi:hypothetical protein
MRICPASCSTTVATRVFAGDATARASEDDDDMAAATFFFFFFFCYCVYANSMRGGVSPADRSSPYGPSGRRVRARSSAVALQ